VHRKTYNKDQAQWAKSPKKQSESRYLPVNPFGQAHV